MPAVVADDISASADVAAVGLWATRLRCPQIHQPGRLSDKTSPRYTPEARLEGRWGFCSGCQGATWVGGRGDHATYTASGDPAFTAVFLADPNAYSSSSDNGTGTLVPEDDGYRATLPIAEGQETPDGLWALVPIERARIEETWDVMGMIGTGSHTVVVEPQHISAAWTFRHSRLGPRDYGPMSVAAGNSAWPIATAVAAVVLGTSRRALDAATDLVRVKHDRQLSHRYLRTHMCSAS